MTLPAAAAAALFGGFSHVLLDAIMHADMDPFRPLAEGNPWLDAVPLGTLHAACLGLGLFALVLFALRLALVAKRRADARGEAGDPTFRSDPPPRA